jgi:hypothetical protein
MVSVSKPPLSLRSIILCYRYLYLRLSFLSCFQLYTSPCHCARLTEMKTLIVKLPVSRYILRKMDELSSNPAFKPAVTRQDLQSHFRPGEKPTRRHHPHEVPINVPRPREAFGTSKTLPGYYQLPLTSVWSEDDWDNSMSQGVAESIQNVYEELAVVAAM